MKACLLITIMLLAFATPTWAKSPSGLPGNLHACGSGVAEKALSGDRLTFTNGQTVSLTEIKAPEYWPQHSSYKSWPYGNRSKEALETLAFGKTILFFCAQKRRQKNHIGDLVAHLVIQTEHLWLQQEMLSRGHAYFFPHFGKTVAAEILLAEEDKARKAAQGLWANDKATVMATGPDVKPGWFQLVRGKVQTENRLKGKTYLNFGDNWRSDFTVEIPKKLYRMFEANTPLLGFSEQWVEARGWVEWAGGPKIILWDRHQIRLVDPPAE